MKIATSKLYLPRTGQVTSYADGDDGYFQAGNPRTTRFIDNLNGTISDRATGLQWVKQPELIIPGATGVQTANQIQAVKGAWADSVAYLAADLVAHNSKWWVCVLAHTGPGDASTDPDTDSTHWRETVWANITTDAVESWAKGATTTLTMTAHAFRVGQLVTISGVLYNTSVASAVNGNRVITAIATNTITVAVNTASEGTPVASAGAVLGANPVQLTWANAVANSLAMTYAGSTDWRLPNVFELLSLYDCSKAARPLLNSLFVGVVTGGYYWSSTTDGITTANAFYCLLGGWAAQCAGRAKTTATDYAYIVRGGRLNLNG